MTGERTTVELIEREGETVQVIQKGRFEGAEYVQTEESVTVETGKFKALKIEPDTHEVFNDEHSEMRHRRR